MNNNNESTWEWFDDEILYGVIIKHCGNPNRSNRVGWQGEVVGNWNKDSTTDGDRVFVKWTCDSFETPFSYAITQSYNIKWFLDNIKQKCCTASINKFNKTVALDNDRMNWITKYCIDSLATSPNYHKITHVKPHVKSGMIVAKVTDYSLSLLRGVFGVVCDVTNGGMITVRWILNNNAELLEEQYSVNYTSESTLCANICGHYSGDYIDSYVKRGDRLPEKKLPVNDNGKYILWSPEGRTVPHKVHKSLADAERVAKIMSDKYDQDFFVCELIMRSFQRKSRTTVTEVVK